MNKKDKHNNYGKLAAAAENGEREREREAPDHDPNELKSTYHDLTFKSRLECRERSSIRSNFERKRVGRYISVGTKSSYKVQTVSMANVPTSSRLFEGNEPLDPPPLPLFESKFVTFRLAGRLA